MNIDKGLLKEQYDFLASYSWREGDEPEQVTGILNLLEGLLEEEASEANLIRMVNALNELQLINYKEEKNETV